MTKTTDVIVLGGGAGGLSAARSARREGLDVVMVTDEPPGGDCTFTGCVPSKTLIRAAAEGLDLSEAMAQVRSVVDHIASTENAEVLRSEGIQVIEARGRFAGPTTIEADGTRINARTVVIATGARPALPSVPGLDAVSALTSSTVWDVDRLPGHLGIVGGGPVGIEMAQTFRRFGAEVTLFEVAERLLPRAEPEASRIVAERLAADGITLHLGTPIEQVQPVGVGARLIWAHGSLDVDRLLVAAGRTPNTDDLGLAEVGIETDRRGRLTVDDTLATTADGVFGVGDVLGTIQLTHAADEMGRIAIANATGRRATRFDASSVPWAVFSSPEVAGVGVTAAEVVGHRGVRIADLPMGENDRAITDQRTTGFVRLISGPQPVIGNRIGGGRIIGATVVGERAGELIAEPTLALRTRMFTGRLAQIPHAYPTWGVAIQKCAAQFFTEIEGRTARPA